jgi:UDP-N-acetylglucosamine 4,6-dehydratase/5-epimerase
MFDDLTVLVTGGTGSFGRAFIQHLLTEHAVKEVFVYSRDELKQFEMHRSAPAWMQEKLRFFIGDIRDGGRLTTACRGVDLVVHAAALKQVVAAENNPMECIRTNVLGAENVVHAALATDVQQVVALSTDKAVNPVNLYGASKLAADKIFVAANQLTAEAYPKFSVVRYGNVLGSRGSIIPTLLEHKEKGASTIPITDRRMTRFWITLEQGVNFVVSCSGEAIGGEIFVPKIPSMGLVDMVDAILPGVEQEEIGIRPGEKIHETLITNDDARLTIELQDKFVIEPANLEKWDASAYQERGGKRVSDEFAYSSDTNPLWMSAHELQRLLSEKVFIDK